jgi:hypothetical protein
VTKERDDATEPRVPLDTARSVAPLAVRTGPSPVVIGALTLSAVIVLGAVAVLLSR